MQISSVLMSSCTVSWTCRALPTILVVDHNGNSRGTLVHFRLLAVLRRYALPIDKLCWVDQTTSNWDVVLGISVCAAYVHVVDKSLSTSLSSGRSILRLKDLLDSRMSNVGLFCGVLMILQCGEGRRRATSLLAYSKWSMLHAISWTLEPLNEQSTFLLAYSNSSTLVDLCPCCMLTLACLAICSSMPWSTSYSIQSIQQSNTLVEYSKLTILILLM